MSETIQKFVNKLTEKFDDINIIIQFGSSVSGDYVKNLSDVDLAVIIKSKKQKKLIGDCTLGLYHLQVHIFLIRNFIKGLKDGLPLNLSILYTGRVLYGHEQFYELKKEKFRATKFTERKCMLNSFAALGLAISDLTHGMLWDSINSIYHAARSSIWAVLMKKEITPNNRSVLKLIGNNKIADLYKRIINFRKNIPNYNMDVDFPKKLYNKGGVNRFTELLSDATTIIKTNYQKIFKKPFIGLFEVLTILKKNYRNPDFYSLFLAVDWEKEILFYHAILSFKNKERKLICINANNGEIKEVLRDG